jgi:hypothetical protein
MMDLLAARRGALIGALVCAFVIVHLGATLVAPREDGRLLRGDSRRYFVYLPSLILDHDLDFGNDALLLQGLDPATVDLASVERTPTGLFGNVAPVGCAIFWAPFFLLGLALQGAAAVFGWASAGDGYGYLPQASVLVAGIFYGGASAWVTARILDRWFPPAVATASSITVWLAGSALYYTAVSPAYSHTTAWFVVAVALYLWLDAREPGRPSAHLRWGLCGLFFGLAATVRQQDAIFLIAPAIDLAWPDGGAPSRSFAERCKAGAALGAGALLGFLPQALVWRTLYGSYLVSPMGPMDVAWTLPDVVPTLFGFGFFGLFTWTPVAALGTVGAFAFARRYPRVGAGLLLAVLLSVYYQSAVYDLHVGTSFGARRFISANVVFALGIAVLWAAVSTWRRRLPLVFAGALIAWNGVLLIGYEVLVHFHGFHPPLRSIVRWLFTGYDQPPY